MRRESRKKRSARCLGTKLSLSFLMEDDVAGRTSCCGGSWNNSHSFQAFPGPPTSLEPHLKAGTDGRLEETCFLKTSSMKARKTAF